MEDGNKTSPRTVEVVEYDAGSGAQKIVATCRLSPDGTVSVEGSGPIAARLKSGVYSPTRGGKVTPADGVEFIDAVLIEFKNIHLFARETE
jgi:hypothetical protein